MIEKSSIQPLNKNQPAAGEYVLYWMQASQRSEDNPALEFAIEQANAAGGVCLLPTIPFAASASGYPVPVLSYTLGGNAIASPAVFPAGTNIITCVATNLAGTNTCSFTVTVLPGPAPQLRIVEQGTNVVVSWPADFNCYTLQVAPTLGNNSWSSYSGPFLTNGGYLFATNAATATSQYFRLTR